MEHSRIQTKAGSGIVTLQSPCTFADTVQRLITVLAEHHIKIFTVIDQQAEARAVGLDMHPSTLIIFGNPKAGTPLMRAEPLATLDLPLKVLVSEEQTGTVLVSCNSAQYIVERHGLAAEFIKNIAPAENLIANALRHAG